jgi:hypothetical protein
MKKQKKTTLITAYGGFHNSPEITIKIPAISEVDKVFAPEIALEKLSEFQRKKLNRHFCGIKGCECGGIYFPSVICEVVDNG